ncbi:MAG TPA: sigma-54 dependent transcriptional regulator [Bacteroidales bacterium]|nr:sigma-54 dependent transcriptional regulator [Bacteroidales bacterium]HPR56987.1 sigma-54 dependent transcriptional regulator [Bacteroidales bacterium]
MKKILIIDDDDFIRKMLASVIQKAGFDVIEAPDGETGLKYVELKNPDLVVTDFKMPGISGLEVLTELVRSHPELPVIMLTAYGDVSLTIKAIQSGAYDYIEKPIKNQELIEAIHNGIQASIQSKSLIRIISPEARKAIEDSLLAGKTPAMREIFKNIGRISLTNVNVVITGEAGTGKEQIGRLIHFSGITREQPFIVLNCQSSNEDLLQQELFGFSNITNNVSGKNRLGKIELAGDGTLYLDEFHELSPTIQSELLRTIQNGEYYKPGDPQPVKLKCRIIAATQKNIEELVNEGKFLSDLYLRLRIFTIQIPPLRERIEDIPELVQNLLTKLNRKLNRKVVKVEDGVNDILKKHSWPGNIRELENVLMQAVILSQGDVLEKKNIILNLFSPPSLIDNTTRLVPLSEIEKEHIKRVLDALKWNKMEASSVLEITRPTLNAKIEKYGLSPG